MLKACWVTSAVIAENLVSADISPRKNDEQMTIERMVGMKENDIMAEEMAIESKPVVTNEVFEAGLKLTLRMADTGNEFTRFLSLSDLDEMVFGTRTPDHKMDIDLALQFGQMLINRKEPITMAIVDSSVDLDEVKRVIGNDPDAVKGNEHGIGFIPKDSGR